MSPTISWFERLIPRWWYHFGSLWKVWEVVNSWRWVTWEAGRCNRSIILGLTESPYHHPASNPASYLDLLVSFCWQFYTTKSYLGRRKSPDMITWWLDLWEAVLIMHWCGRVQPNVGVTISWSVLNCISLECSYRWASKQCSSMVSASALAPTFFNGPLPGSVRQINLSPQHCFWSWCL